MDLTGSSARLSLDSRPVGELHEVPLREAPDLGDHHLVQDVQHAIGAGHVLHAGHSAIEAQRLHGVDGHGRACG